MPVIFLANLYRMVEEHYSGEESFGSVSHTLPWLRWNDVQSVLTTDNHIAITEEFY